MSLSDLLGKALPRVRQNVVALEAPMPLYTLVVSLCDRKQRASIAHASAGTFDVAWQKVVSRCRRLVEKEKLEPEWIRVDWVKTAEKMTWEALETKLKQTKRGYFRYGLALDGSFHKVFLEQELNANAMLYGGNKIPHAIINRKNFSIYAGKKYKRYRPVFSGDVYLLNTQGVFYSEEEAFPQLLFPSGRSAGRRMGPLDQQAVHGLIQRGSRYLSTQVQPSGQFHYGWHPCFDRPINAYNALRHASTTYSMLEAWEVTGDKVLKASIDRALHYLTETLIHHVSLKSGEQVAFLVDQGGEIKLGGNAVCLLALTKYTEVAGDGTHLGLIERLAQGIRYMQDPATGAFVHVLNYSDLSVKEEFRIIYYEGEAAFGLMRAYGLTKDPHWIEMVEKAFEHFIANDTWKAHDHWLSYCVNELTKYRPEERYYRFGIQNVGGYLDFILARLTTFPTLLELLMAAEKMICRIQEEGAYQYLLEELDIGKFYRALEYRARYLLNGHFWPEYAMYFKNPERVLGSFYIRHHGFRVRIDDVEHYLSGYVAYLRFLEKEKKTGGLSDVQERRSDAGSLGMNATLDYPWTAKHLEKATGGTWATPPRQGWRASGLCIYAPTMQHGNMVSVRTKDGAKGVPLSALKNMQYPPAGLMTSEPERLGSAEAPVLKVEDTGEAILALGEYARQQISGKVLAVTGSAGKTTTVAMLAHALAPWGKVAKASHNANLPHGVAWNIASMPWDALHVVLELAIGRMGQSSMLARPDVAIFTNILPAHLGDKSTLRDIAETKSAIFRGMVPGGVAVINRDMKEWEVVYHAALSKGLRVLHYGETEESDFQLVGYDVSQGGVTVRHGGRDIEYCIGAPGKHMVLNSLAVLAAIHSLGYELDKATPQLAGFKAAAGRGEQLEITVSGKRISLIDDAYNANPGSMEAALCQLGDIKSVSRRVVVMGEMAELGSQAEGYHTALAALIEDNGIDRVYVMGDLYINFWSRIPASRRGRHVSNLEELQKALLPELDDGDVVLIKGSHSTQLHRLVERLKSAEGGAFRDG